MLYIHVRVYIIIYACRHAQSDIEMLSLTVIMKEKPMALFDKYRDEMVGTSFNLGCNVLISVVLFVRKCVRHSERSLCSRQTSQ